MNVFFLDWKHSLNVEYSWWIRCKRFRALHQHFKAKTNFSSVSVTHTHQATCAVIMEHSTIYLLYGRFAWSTPFTCDRGAIPLHVNMYLCVYLKGHFHRWFNIVYKFPNHECDNYGEADGVSEIVSTVYTPISILLLIDVEAHAKYVRDTRREQRKSEREILSGVSGRK